MFASLFVVALMMALSSPLGGYPDEPDHMIRAAGVVYGQVQARNVSGSAGEFGTGALVQAPASIVSARAAELCLWGWPHFGRPIIPATCVRPLSRSHQMMTIADANGRYPPLYYALVGWPLRLWPDAFGMYAVRGVSALFWSLLVSLALAVYRRCSRGIGMWSVGVLCALSPMALYLSGGVNPSSLEIAAGLATWLTGLAVLSARPSRGSVHVFGVSMCLLALSRSISPLWLALILVSLGCFTGWRKVRTVLRARAMRAWMAAATASSLLQVAWVVRADALKIGGQPHPELTSTASAVIAAVESLGSDTSTMIGKFGWFDTPFPSYTLVVWLGLVGALALVAAATAAHRRHLGALGLALAITACAPVLLQLPSAANVGLQWQGRYLLPFAVGVPVLAGAIVHERIGPRPLARRVAGLSAGCLWLGVVAAHLYLLRRYGYGSKPGANPFGGAWQPPGGAALCAAILMIALAAWYALVVNSGELRAAE